MTLGVYTFTHSSVISHTTGLNSFLAEHVAGMAEITNAYKILRRKHERKNRLGDPGINGRMALK
jgi:hypothetical protein